MSYSLMRVLCICSQNLEEPQISVFNYKETFLIQACISEYEHRYLEGTLVLCQLGSIRVICSPIVSVDDFYSDIFFTSFTVTGMNCPYGVGFMCNKRAVG